jgi:hypothetical protein
VYPIFRFLRRAGLKSGLAAAALLIAACHSNTSDTSGYGVVWVTLGTVPAPIFTSYVVTVDSVTLTDALGNTYTALSTPEPVDLANLRDYREMWGSGTVPNASPGTNPPDQYVSATLVLDYSNAEISVLVNGLPQRATVVSPNGSALTTLSVKINLDPAQPLIITPSYSTDNAQVLAFNFDLPASNLVNLATTPATVTVEPFVTVALAPPDNELIRVRGPLINSSVPLSTFTVYERPFFDQSSALGQLTIFNNPGTLYTVDGVSYSGPTGLNILSQTPAGVTETASFTTFEPTATATAFAGKFYSVYTIGGSSLQSTLTENIAGDVVAVSSDATTGVNTLTLRGATVYGPLVALSEGYFGYQNTDSQLLVGPGTVVTIDDRASSAGLSYKSIAVGDHVEGVGAYACAGTCGTTGTGTWTIDATSPATGKVRILQTPIFGQLQSATTNSLTMALQTVNYWPAADFDFAGNGTSSATDPSAAAFTVSTPTVDLAGTAAGTPVWINGISSNFGAAPPDFIASSVATTSPSTGLTTVPAQLLVSWASAGTVTPFSSLTSGAFSIDLQDANLSSAVLQIGPLAIPLDTLPASPQIITTNTPISITNQPLFSPHFAFGTVSTVSETSSTSTVVDVSTVHVNVFTTFGPFVSNFVAAISHSSPALQLTANGTYDSATNTFIANTVSVVL